MLRVCHCRNRNFFSSVLEFFLRASWWSNSCCTGSFLCAKSDLRGEVLPFFLDCMSVSSAVAPYCDCTHDCLSAIQRTAAGGSAETSCKAEEAQFLLRRVSRLSVCFAALGAQRPWHVPQLLPVVLVRKDAVGSTGHR